MKNKGVRSKIIQDILDSITPEQQAKIDANFKKHKEYHQWMVENGLKFNTPTSPSLITLREAGFNPIGITGMMCEETFIFETEEEALKAYHTFEMDENDKWLGTIAGWWYGKENWNEVWDEYVERTYNGMKQKSPNVYWL